MTTRHCAGLALLELSLWRGIDGGILVVPRIPMKTVLVGRGVVTIDTVGAPATTQSEAEYFDRLGVKHPEFVEPLRSFLAELPGIGVTPDYRRPVALRFAPSPDIIASAGYVDANGAGTHTAFIDRRRCPFT